MSDIRDMTTIRPTSTTTIRPATSTTTTIRPTSTTTNYYYQTKINNNYYYQANINNNNYYYQAIIISTTTFIRSTTSIRPTSYRDKGSSLMYGMEGYASQPEARCVSIHRGSSCRT